MAGDKKRKRDQAANVPHAATQHILASLPNAPTLPPAAVQEAFTVLPSPPPVARKKQRKTTKRKTLTSKGRKAVVLNVLATVEAQKMSAGATTSAPPPAVVQPPPPPQHTGDVDDAAATCNKGKAWSKADLTKRARLAEDPAYLRQVIPDHPLGDELDWEIISRFFGRFSKGGTAVKQQYYSVVRLMKEARREGRKGSNYVDLVKKAIGELPNQQGTVFDIQRILKDKYIKHLDKYKVKGKLRWKKAVGEILKEETTLFRSVTKTDGGKYNVWELIPINSSE